MNARSSVVAALFATLGFAGAAPAAPRVAIVRAPGDPVTLTSVELSPHDGGLATCVAFVNRAHRTATAVDLDFVFLDASGAVLGQEVRVRSGRFAPGAALTARAENCWNLAAPPAFAVVRAAIMDVTFDDESHWDR